MADYTVTSRVISKSIRATNKTWDTKRFYITRTAEGGKGMTWAMSPKVLRELADMLNDALDEHESNEEVRNAASRPAVSMA